MKSKREKDGDKIILEPKTLEQMYPSIIDYHREMKEWEDESRKSNVLHGGIKRAY